MRGDDDAILVIHDGGLAALAAALLDEAPERVVAWVPPAGSPLDCCPLDDSTRRGFIDHQSRLLGYREVVQPAPGRWWAGPTDGLSASTLLLAAVGEAVRRGARRVLWPACADGDLDLMYEAAERAGTITSLAILDIDTRRTGREIRVETPFADLTHAQLLELADDLDAPLEACWWPAGLAEADRPKGAASTWTA